MSKSNNIDDIDITPARVIDFCKEWHVLDSLPNGWKIDKSAGSPYPCSEFATNGKSVLSGHQKRAIIKIDAQPFHRTIKHSDVAKRVEEVKNIKPTNKQFPSRTLNELARKSFIHRLLKEIMFDLMVCELEGWDKKEYISQIKQLLLGIKL